MDFQRLALVAALLLVSVMLLTEWVQFSKEHPLAVVPAPVVGAPGEPLSPSVPEPASTTATTDVPPPPGDSQRPVQSEPVAVAAPQVLVKTDTLELTISLTGGDIEAVSLPRYPAELDNPKQRSSSLAIRMRHSMWICIWTQETGFGSSRVSGFAAAITR
jgi:YidC/Oxa1 family membrane protein insertase